MRQLFYDCETRSVADLTKIGTWHYVRHPTTDLRCVSYCLVVDGVRGLVETWWPGDPVPQTILDFAADPTALAVAFNDAFDRQVWDCILTPKYGWPVVPFERHRCAMAATLARALPGSLDAAAAALGITTRKTKAGTTAMLKLARPRPQTKAEKKVGAPPDFHASAEDLATLGVYNRNDVLMTMEIVDRVGLLSDSEQAVWVLDQRINERGAHADIKLIDAALTIGEEARIDLNREISALTGGTITTANQRDRILKWLGKEGCTLPNLSKETVADALLEGGLPDGARALLERRRAGAGAAGLKFATLRRWTNGEDQPRIRYAYRYHGASSGRFTSLGCQLHNLKKPEIDDVRGAIDAVATGSLAEMRRRGFNDPLRTIGYITRAVISAPPGKRLFIADLSGIEARGAAYIVGDDEELEQWRTFDHTGKPEDEPYYRCGITTFNQPPEKARKTGKTGTLAFQYQGGVGAYRRITGDIETPDEVIAARRDAWRRDHPKYTAFWTLATFQAIQAIDNPGEEFTARTVSFRFDRSTGFLEMKLPSGRILTYPKAELYEDEQYDSVSFTFFDASGGGAGRMYHERKGRGAFGGLLLENATQAICRDIFVEAMPRLETAGYPIVTHTHDDYCCEAGERFGSLEEFLAIICVPPSFAPVIPIAAKGRISDRFIEIAGDKPRVVDHAIDNAALDLAEGDELAAVLCESDANEDRGIKRPQTAHEPPEGSLHSPSSPPPPQSQPSPQPANGRGGGNGGRWSDDDFGYPRGESPGPTGGPPAAEYIYKNACGFLHMRVVKTTAKTYPTYRWNETTGSWDAGWPDEVVPYRLPEMLATPVDTLVLICEGEKDCETANAHGFTATTHPGGAGKWRKELAQYFAGRKRVCIAEDNDDPGKKNTAAILRALRSVVPEIGVLRFPELPAGGDLTDFFERGGTAAGLQIRIDDAMKAGVIPSYVLRSVRDIPFDELHWLWPGYLPAGVLILVTGQTGTGKTFWVCDIIARVTRGLAWPDGTPGSGCGNVIALTAEDNDKQFRHRLMGAGADIDRVQILKYIRKDERDRLFLLAEDLEALEAACRDTGDVKLITVDPITAYMGSGRGFDSHRATDVRSQLMPLKDVAERTDIPVIGITHPSKSAAQRAALDAFIGSQAFIATARVGIYLLDELGPPDDRGFRRSTGRVLFTVPKMSDGPKPPTRAFHQEDVPIGCVDRGDGINHPVMTRRIVWDKSTIDLTADEARAAHAPTPSAARGDGRKMRSAPVRELLRSVLSTGPVPQKTVVERGAEQRFSLQQLRRARDAIGARTFKQRGGGLKSPWLWALADDTPADAIFHETNEPEKEA
jgi:DNA polymerase